MRGKDGNLGNISIRIVEYKLSDVVCGDAGVFGLREAVVADLDLIVIVEALNDTAALADVDDRSSPLAVLAIIEEVALDEDVTRTAALIPLEGIGFKLNRRAAAVEVVVADDGLALRRKKHSSCAVVADDVVLDQRLGVIVKAFDDHTLGDNFGKCVESEDGFVVIQNVNLGDDRLGERHLRLLLEDLDAVAL